MKPVLVVNVQVRTPVANLCSALKLRDLEDGVVKAVVDCDVLLLLVHKLQSGGRRNVMEWTVRDSRPGLRRDGVGRELDVLRSSVRVDLRARRASRRNK